MGAPLDPSARDPALVDAMTVAELLGEVAAILEPPPRVSAAAWADAHRIMPPDAPMPGPWRSSLVPYTVAICEAFEDPAVRQVIALMGAQMSKTETILNIIGKGFDYGPLAPTLYVGPTQKQVTSMSNDRFRKMIDATPRIKSRMAGGHMDKTTEKWIAGVRLGFAWAGSATELSSHPAGRVLVDELDRMESDVDGEGDPWELACARMDAYANAVAGAFSTPTIEGASAIWALFLEGTMRRWAWPCDHCAQPFVPRLSLLVFDSSAPVEQIRNTAYVACPHCGGDHQDNRRRALNAGGLYLYHREDTDGELVPCEPRRMSTESFQISGLASPFIGFGESAERLIKAYRSKRPERIQSVVNTRFGELFKMTGDAPEWQEVLELVEPVPRGELPVWARMVTVGTDVQKDGLFYVVRAWGFDPVARCERSHLLDHGFIAGDTEFDEVWLEWQRVLFQEYLRAGAADATFAAAKSAGLYPQLGLVDSGYNPRRDRHRRPEHKVYEACRRTGWRALPSKGYDTQDAPVKLSKIDRLPSGRTIAGGLKLWRIHTDHFKSWLHATIRQSNAEDAPAKLWTLHAETDDDYCRQIVSEQLVIKPSGDRVWVLPNHRANHYLDCEVLARAAAYIHRAKLLPSHPAHAEAAVGARVNPAPSTPAPAAPARPENSYFRVEPGSYFRR